MRLTPPPCRLLPKSARWLMANNQKEEAWKLIQKAAQMNGIAQSKDLEMLRVSVHAPAGGSAGPPAGPHASGAFCSQCDESQACPSTLVFLQTCSFDEKPEVARKHSFIDLIRTPKMRKQSLIIFYLWYV